MPGLEWDEDYTPSTADQIRAAMAADRKEQRRRQLAAEMQHGLDMFTAGRVLPRSAPSPFDDNLKAFLLSRKAEGEDTDRAWRQGEPERQARLLQQKTELTAAERAAQAEQRAAEREEERRWREQQALEERKWRTGEAEKDRTVRREGAQATLDARTTLNEGRKADQERKQEEADAKRYISEDFTETAKPLPPPVLADLQKRGSSTRVVIDNSQQLEKMLADGGPALWGERAGEMEMLINNIWTELKDIKGLGVLAGPDMGILQGIVTNPASLGSVLRDASKVKALLPQIKKFQARMKGDMVQRVAGYGAKPAFKGLYYQEPDTQQGGAGAGGTPPANDGRVFLDGRVYQKGPDGKWVDLGPEVK